MSANVTREKIVVAALYHFAHLPHHQTLRGPLLALCLAHGIKGTILLAGEGINATVAGSRRAIDAFLTRLRAEPHLRDLTHKESLADEAPFHRIKVRLKKEIVTMGVPGTDPRARSGARVSATRWNELLADPGVLVIDTRNDYEHAIGTFANAISPNTASFREFPGWAERELAQNKQQKVAMFCTGGIRCEKASNYLLGQGFTQVFHLDGGILKYLETVATEHNLWRGECFVFDERVALDTNLRPGTHVQCFACRRPVSPEDRESGHYRTGVSCPHCVSTVSADKKARLAERQRQIELAQARNTQHIGIPLE